MPVRFIQYGNEGFSFSIRKFFSFLKTLDLKINLGPFKKEQCTGQKEKKFKNKEKHDNQKAIR